MKITCGRCGMFLELNRLGLYGYCRECHNEAVRRCNQGRQLSADERAKKNCRSRSHKALRRGKLIPQPCEKCGSAIVEMHHEDYSKPLDVKWLCKECHVDLHTQRNRQEALKELEAQNSNE